MYKCNTCNYKNPIRTLLNVHVIFDHGIVGRTNCDKCNDFSLLLEENIRDDHVICSRCGNDTAYDLIESFINTFYYHST